MIFFLIIAATSQAFAEDSFTLNIKPSENTTVIEEAVSKELEKPKDQIALLDIDTSILTPPQTAEAFSVPDPVIETPYKNPFIASSLSGIIPGLGHFYLNDPATAGEFLGATGVGFGLILDPFDFQANTTMDGIVFLQTTQLYSVYAAYRDARAYNDPSIYRTSMPQETFSDLAWASFSPSIVSKFEVWGGLLGCFTLATAVSHLGYGDIEEGFIANRVSTDDLDLFPGSAFLIGIGEEAYFRGYLQSALIEATTPSVGITLSSLLFGAAHIPNALLLPEQEQWRYYTYSLPLITALGAYFGFLTYKNNSLQESVAIHGWYDFLVFSLSNLTSEAAISKPRKIGISIPF